MLQLSEVLLSTSLEALSGGVKGQGLNKSPGSGSRNDICIARNANVLVLN